VSERGLFGLVGSFASPEAVTEAARQLRSVGFREIEAYTPYPVEGLAELLHPGRRILLPLVIALGALFGVEPEEIAKAMPEADKKLDVEAFVPCDQVDDVYFDRPYYLAPSAPAAILTRIWRAIVNVLRACRGSTRSIPTRIRA
jgi:hypothetical protein